MIKRSFVIGLFICSVFLGTFGICACSLPGSSKHGADTIPRLRYMERNEEGEIYSYVHIEVPAFPGCVTEIQCYEDQFGKGEGEERRDGSLILRHTWGNVRLTAHLIPVPGAILFHVYLLAPTKEEARSVATVSPCWQFPAAKEKKGGDYVNDFVNNCFIYTMNGFTYLKDTIRFRDRTPIPGAAPLPDDDPQVLNPQAQVYVPIWETYKGLPELAWGNSPDQPIYSLMGFASPDGEYLTAWGWLKSLNLAQGMNWCLHPNPNLWSDVKELDKGFMFRGKMYFMENDPEKLLARYLDDFPQDWQTKISLLPTEDNHLCVKHSDLEDESPHLVVDVKLEGKDLVQERNAWRSHPWGTLTREGGINEGRYKIWARPSGDFVALYATVENRTDTVKIAEMNSSIEGSSWEKGHEESWATSFAWEKESMPIPPGGQETFRGRIYLFKVGAGDTMQAEGSKRMKEAAAEWQASRPFRLLLP